MPVARRARPAARRSVPTIGPARIRGCLDVSLREMRSEGADRRVEASDVVGGEHMAHSASAGRLERGDGLRCVPLELRADRADPALGAFRDRARRAARAASIIAAAALSRRGDRVARGMLAVEHARDRRFHCVVGCACGGAIFGEGTRGLIRRAAALTCHLHAANAEARSTATFKGKDATAAPRRRLICVRRPAEGAAGCRRAYRAIAVEAGAPSSPRGALRILLLGIRSRRERIGLLHPRYYSRACGMRNCPCARSSKTRSLQCDVHC